MRDGTATHPRTSNQPTHQPTQNQDESYNQENHYRYLHDQGELLHRLLLYTIQINPDIVQQESNQTVSLRVLISIWSQNVIYKEIVRIN